MKKRIEFMPPGSDSGNRQERSPADRDIVVLYLDGVLVKLRVGRKVERVPLLIAPGVRSDGGEELLWFSLIHG